MEAALMQTEEKQVPLNDAQKDDIIRALIDAGMSEQDYYLFILRKRSLSEKILSVIRRSTDY